MITTILDGKIVATFQKNKLKQAVALFTEQHNRAPGLAVILVGDDPASQIYVDRKKAACKEVAITSHYKYFPKTATQNELIEAIDTLNGRKDIDGILVQLPLPDHIDSHTIIQRILPEKDVDGFHPINIGRLVLKQPMLSPCTPRGVMRLLQYYGISPEGQHAVILGTSNIVGRPLALELLAANATITLCHSKTKGLENFVRMADILVVAIGNPNIIKSEWLQPHQVIVDIGINRLKDNSICGDIPYEFVKNRVKAITPVPGGVGPMTIVSLLENCLKAAIAQQNS